jgi:NAD(P)-dependent dehydrogenase (short-subunit alcohol dehydrogenase family)
MQGKIILITGATEGVGKVSALTLAKMGATVVVVGRNPQKTQSVVDTIKQAGGSAEGMVADLSLMAQVRRLAAEFKQKFNRLDVLMNNAGAVFAQRQETAEGYEMTFALNHLNYFLLTKLLLDLLQATGQQNGKPTRIVNVSSNAHIGAVIDFDDLQSKRHYNPWRAYPQSKLANVLFTYELARRVNSAQIVTNVLHPGAVATGFGRSNGGIYDFFFRLIAPFMLTAEQGAQTQIYLASSPQVEGVTGRYFEKKRAVKSSFASYDTDTARRLWEVSEALTANSA